MEKLCAMDISDLGKGFYRAEDIFGASSVESYFYDSESGINEHDLQELVDRVVAVIRGNGSILADTYSYDYDPFPQVCYYNGEEIVSKLLYIDGEEFNETVEITNIAEWIRFVDNAEGCDNGWDEEEDDGANE